MRPVTLDYPGEAPQFEMQVEGGRERELEGEK